MLAALGVTLLASIWPGPAAPIDLPAVAARYQAECTGGKRAATCDQLQGQLEASLYADLMTLYLSGAKVERSLLQVGAKARLPELAAFSLRRLEWDLTAADEPLVLAALDSPYPAVRAAALACARKSQNPRLSRAGDRAAGRRSGGDAGLGLTPDPVPTAEQLGSPVYPGAKYVFLASDEAAAIFRTADPVDKVVAFYGKGKKAYSGAEMKAATEARRETAEAEEAALEKAAEEGDMAAMMAKAAEMMAAMNSGQDPAAAMQDLATKEQARGFDWTEGVEGKEGITGARYVVVEEKGTAPKTVPTKVVAVWRDEVLGGTAIRILRRPELDAARAVPTDPSLLMELQELRMLPVEGGE